MLYIQQELFRQSTQEDVCNDEQTILKLEMFHLPS